MRAFNPAGVPGPFGSYSHGIEVESPMRLVFGAGQTGVDTDGRNSRGCSGATSKGCSRAPA